MRRALLALQLAKEINDNPEILPSYEVFFLNLICSGLELMILNLFFPKNDSCVVMPCHPCWMIRLVYSMFVTGVDKFHNA